MYIHNTGMGRGCDILNALEGKLCTKDQYYEMEERLHEVINDVDEKIDTVVGEIFTTMLYGIIYVTSNEIHEIHELMKYNEIQVQLRFRTFSIL